MTSSIAAYGESSAIASEHRPIGKIDDLAAVCALCPADEAFGMKDIVHRRRPQTMPEGALPGSGEGQRMRTPAFEAGPMTGRQRGHLIEEEQFGIAIAPDTALAAFEIELAADPLLRRIAAIAEGAVIAVDVSAAIAHEQTAHGVRDKFT